MGRGLGRGALQLSATTTACAAAVLIQVYGAELQWQATGPLRWAELNVPSMGKTGFALLRPEQTGIAFTNTVGELEGAANRVLLNGSGVALGDFDKDGFTDIFLCALTTPSALYQNLGQWRFEDVTSAAGLQLSGRHFRAAVFEDVNGDGWLDLLVSATGRGVFCFLNDAQGKFRDATRAAGTFSKFDSVTMALADVDQNGTLDLYVTNYRAEDIRDRGRTYLQLVRGQITVPPALRDRFLVVNGQVLEYGEPDQLYLGDGKGSFTAVPWTEGRFLDEAGKKLERAPLDWGLTGTLRDINGDGAPDIYVCNDYWTPDRIWLNDGRGGFRAISKRALRNTSASSMGLDVADVDRDGHMDLFVVDMLSRDPKLRKRQMLAYTPAPRPVGAIEEAPQLMRNTFFHNRGDGTFEEIANLSGVTASEWSWQPVFIDVDLDGYEDLLITTGNVKDVQDLDATAAIEARQHSWSGYPNEVERQKAFTQERMVHSRLYPDLRTPIVAFRNQRDLKFTETTRDWGTDQPGVHHGISLGDLDADGDLDFVVNNFGAAAGVYRNESNTPRVAVRLRGVAPNTRGIGAKATLLGGAVPMQMQEVVAGGRYMSGSDPLLVFAAGSLTNKLSLEVIWRSGKRSIIDGIKANRIYEIDEASASVAQTFQSAGSGDFPVDRPSSAGLENPANPQIGKSALQPKPLFEDASHLLNHKHVDEPFDDFGRQSLLPRKLSQLGPGVCWFDVNSDGWDDLIIGSGRGGQLGVFLNDTKGGFKRTAEPPFSFPVTRDQTAVLGLQRGDAKALLLAGSSNYEDGLALGAPVRQYDIGLKKIDDTLPGQISSTGPLALADIDADGDLDLFVGARVVPGRYPEAASSMLLRNDKDRWLIDADLTKALANIGLVSAAIWSDLDTNGFPDLVLACEWGPLQVFKNQAGKLRDATTELGLDKYLGWWNGVTTADLDADGRLDIIAGNWGYNTPHRATVEGPLRLYFADFAQRQSVEIVETEFDRERGVVLPRRMLNPIAAAIPSIRQHFSTHKAFAEASIDDLLKVLPAKPQQLLVNTLASTVFLNRGNGFEASELPREAQLAPVFSVNAGDFDGDGNEDLFLSQNFFATEPETPALDAGRGLWLRGRGDGKLTASSAQQSGIEVYGEQRGAASADFDGDGRLDLVVTQNGAATRLFRNLSGTPGLRLQLKGAAGNLAGIGAVIRLSYGERKGPAREIRAGSGYWSQDSAVQIFGGTERPAAVTVMWPGGRSTTTKIPPTAQEVKIDSSGELLGSGRE